MSMPMTLGEDLAMFAGIKGMVVLVRVTHPDFSACRIKVVLEGDELRFAAPHSWVEPLVVKVPDGETPEAALAAVCAAKVRRHAADLAAKVASAEISLTRLRAQASEADERASRLEVYVKVVKDGVL